MKTVVIQANLDEVVDLVRKFAHDEFARTLGVATLSEQDVRGFLLERLRSMQFQTEDLGDESTVKRVYDCVYVLPRFARLEGGAAIEARLLVMPDARLMPKSYIVISA
ncbi:hypothetical protein [Pandoraea sputorum]|uniref:hypothetical protein n=1 Tax=Pandoraea sputorum TaxID=93222 RepID=UPI001242F516|nr:hypothetical protein [Pandoraea sputorum]VVE54416.1 hypothetical protein PSP20601_04907 [Pandoraea sputorum]